VTSYYSSSAKEFVKASNNEILGQLSKGQSEDSHQLLERKQTSSWIAEIEILKKVLSALTNIDNNAGILLEYFIPRRGKRIDAVILANNVIMVLEFKINIAIERGTNYKRHDLEQCEDYALDLRDFHKESKGKIIVPILIDTSVNLIKSFVEENEDLVKETRAVNDSISLLKAIFNCVSRFGSANTLDVNRWDSSVYEPTPTIIEAAQRLYASHGVKDITTTGADRYNLTYTTNAVLNAVNYAREQNAKAIVFVTGVPGSGKTLVGLNIAHDEEIRFKGYNASFRKKRR
jgi:hypothetical protein